MSTGFAQGRDQSVILSHSLQLRQQLKSTTPRLLQMTMVMQILGLSEPLPLFFVHAHARNSSRRRCRMQHSIDTAIPQCNLLPVLQN
jgi:hypothetical protein